MKPWTESRIIVYSSLALAVGGSEWSASCLGSFTPGKEPRYPLRDWVGPRTSLYGFGWEESSYLCWYSKFWTIQPVISHYTDYWLPEQYSTVNILFTCKGKCVKFLKFPTSGCVYRWLCVPVIKLIFFFYVVNTLFFAVIVSF